MDGTLTADGSLGSASRLKAVWRGDSGVLLGLLLVAALFGFLIGPQFFRPANLELMAIQTVIVCVAALVLPDGREAIWDNDGTAGLEAQIMRNGVLVGFVPSIPGAENFGDGQIIGAIADE